MEVTCYLLKNAYFLILQTHVRKGVLWGWEGAERGGEVGENPPPPTEAITGTETVSPSSPLLKGQTLWDAPNTVQIHKDLPFLLS